MLERAVADRRSAKGKTMSNLTTYRERLSGRVAIPALMWLAGLPLGVVLLIWFFFFRG